MIRQNPESVDKLVVVNREGAGAPWQLYKPTMVVEADKTIWALNVEDFSDWAIAVLKDNPTDVEDSATGAIPKRFGLLQNYPNPFNPATTIQFALPQSSHVTLKIFDIRGRIVATLVDEKLTAGQHRVVFDASGLTSGVYFYRMQAKNFQAIRKLALVK